MIRFPGTSVFAVRNLDPAPNSFNVARRALTERASANVAAIKDGLRNASVGVPAPSIDNLKAPKS